MHASFIRRLKKCDPIPELKELLKTAKQDKITKFFKPLLKPEDNM